MCLLENETHVANYCTFKMKETNVGVDPQQNNSCIVLSRNPKAIKNNSKIILWTKSRNCDVIGDFIKITLL